MGSDIDILVAGANCDAVATAAAAVPGIAKVLVADNAAYEHQLAENISLLVADVAAGYDNILAPATPNCKNFMPRVAATAGCCTDFRRNISRVGRYFPATYLRWKRDRNRAVC